MPGNLKWSSYVKSHFSPLLMKFGPNIHLGLKATRPLGKGLVKKNDSLKVT